VVIVCSGGYGLFLDIYKVGGLFLQNRHARAGGYASRNEKATDASIDEEPRMGLGLSFSDAKLTEDEASCMGARLISMPCIWNRFLLFSE
jgi:hypothetical protein